MNRSPSSAEHIVLLGVAHMGDCYPNIAGDMARTPALAAVMVSMAVVSQRQQSFAKRRAAVANSSRWFLKIYGI